MKKLFLASIAFSVVSIMPSFSSDSKGMSGESQSSGKTYGRAQSSSQSSGKTYGGAQSGSQSSRDTSGTHGSSQSGMDMDSDDKMPEGHAYGQTPGATPRGHAYGQTADATPRGHAYGQTFDSTRDNDNTDRKTTAGM